MFLILQKLYLVFFTLLRQFGGKPLLLILGIKKLSKMLNFNTEHKFVKVNKKLRELKKICIEIDSLFMIFWIDFQIT